MSYFHTPARRQRLFQCLLGLMLLVVIFALHPRKTFSATPPVVINEVLVSNTGTNVDPVFTNFESWIELYNSGSSTINLKNYTITDDLSEPDKWEIRNNFNIAPGDYVLIWADDQNKQPNHTGFGLKDSGEEVGLFAPDGSLVDSVSFGKQIRDVSLGRDTDGGSTWVYFAEPSPEGPNSGGVADNTQTAEPSFSHANGFYNNAINVTLSSPAGAATVHYTLDGTEPTTSSPQANGSIAVSDTAVIRAKSFEPGKLPSNTVTHTYFIGESSDLPVFSLVTDPDNFFDNQIGIYVRGSNGITGNCIDYRANWNQSWERPISLEFFEANGSLGFQFDAGVELQGGCSRRKPIKSLDVKLNDRYGPDELKYDLFPGHHIKEFKAFLLRSSGNDQTRTMFRDGMVQTLLDGQMDIDKQAFRPAILFINGEYWGIHNIREKLNDDYIDSHHNEDDVDLIKNRWEVKEGDLDAYTELERYIKDHNLANDTYYNYVASQIDIDEYINYQIAEIYSGNFDWPGNNIRLWRPRDNNGQWRWMIFDTDIAWTSPSKNSMNWATDPNASKDWSTLFLRNLLKNDTFRDEFIQRFAVYINLTYDPARVLPIIEQMRADIEDEMPRHSARWGTPSVNYWESQVQVLRDYAQERPDHMREDLENYFNLSGSQTLTVNVSGNGKVLINGVELPNGTYSGLHFKGVPIRLSAVPGASQSFIGWQGLGSSAQETTVTLNGNLTITAEFSNDTAPPPQLVINEIHYNPSDVQGEDDDYEFLEIVNTGSNSVDLSGMAISEGVTFTFPNGASIAPGEIIVLAKNSATYDGNGYQVFQWEDGSLSNGGEELKLVDSNANEIDVVDYDDEGDWATSPDGDGPSLALIDTALDNSLAASWQPSAVVGGTPGQPNDSTTPPTATPTLEVSPTPVDVPPLVINEIHYNPSDAQGDDDDYEFIEIINTGSSSVDLSGMAISEGITFTFPNGASIAPNEIIVLAKNSATYSGNGYQVFQWEDGSLSNGGEELKLVDSSSNEIDSVSYDDEGDWPTSPDGDGPSLALIDTALDNSLAASWQPSAALGGTPGQVNGAAAPPTATPTSEATATPTMVATATPTDMPPPTPTATTPPDGCTFVPGNLISNPSFEDGTSDWSFSPGSAGYLTTTQPGTHCDQAGAIQIRQSSRNAQFFQKNVALKPATTYDLSFDVYVSQPHTIRVGLLRHTSPYTNYGLREDLALSAGWQSFSFTFTTNGFGSPVSDGRLRFKLNTPPTNAIFAFDNLVLVEQGASPTATPTLVAPPTATATATPTSDAPTPTMTPTSDGPPATPTPTSESPTATPTSDAPTPTATPSAPSGDNQVSNGDFENGTADWRFYSSGGGGFSAVNSSYDGSNSAELSIRNASNNIQFYQTDIELKANTRYRIQFAARSDSGGDMKLYLHKHTSPYTKYGINGVRFNLTNDWQQFTYEFTTSGFSGTVDDARLRFWLSGMASNNDTYWLDNVVLEEITP